jgi:hypothetical protein
MAAKHLTRQAGLPSARARFERHKSTRMGLLSAFNAAALIPLGIATGRAASRGNPVGRGLHLHGRALLGDKLRGSMQLKVLNV